MDHSQQTRRRAFVSTIAIMGSRILGLVREQVFAFFFGASAAYDAFVVAYRIPNLMRDLTAEGALSQSFVTIFSQKLATNNKDDAHDLAHRVNTFILIAVGLIVILGILFSNLIANAVGAGFSSEKIELTSSLMKILFPYILFTSLSALTMGMLNALGKFFIPHSASTFFNITSIIFGILGAWLLAPDYIENCYHQLFHDRAVTNRDFAIMARAITGMAYGTLIGGFAQYLFQLPTAFKSGFKIKLDFNFKDATFIKVLKLTGPAIVGGAAVQVNVLINTYFASQLADGSVSYLTYAFRFMQFPLGVFGVAIASASAPALAQLVAQQNFDRFRQTIQSSIRLSLFLSIPSTIGLMVLGPEIIALIYQHGQFNVYDTQQTALALATYSLGISSYSLIKIYQPAYLAFHDAKTPMKISFFSIVANTSINAFFVYGLHLSHWALALGTAIVASINLILLSYFFTKKQNQIWHKELWVGITKIVFAGLAMGAAVWFVKDFLGTAFPGTGLSFKLFRTFVPIFVSLPVFFGLAVLLNIPEVEAFKRRLLR